MAKPDSLRDGKDRRVPSKKPDPKKPAADPKTKPTAPASAGPAAPTAPAAPTGPAAPASPTAGIDLSKYAPLSKSLVEYYGGAANQAYKVQKQKGADGKMEIVITPVDQNSGRRTLRIQYQGQPDPNGIMQGTLVIDDKMSVPVTFDTKRGMNLIDPEQADKLMKYINPTTDKSEETKNKTDETNNSPQAFEFFSPFNQPATAPTQPQSPIDALARNPSFWEKLGDTFVTSLPLLITALFMRSNDSEA